MFTQKKCCVATIWLICWKVFAVRDGKLESPFMAARHHDLNPDKPIDVIPYEANKQIKVEPETSTFFAFEKLDHAYDVANIGRRIWNTVNSKLIVLPVTLDEVVFEGDFYSPSQDIQCMDGYYPAYEAKIITVHDSPEIRRDLYLKIAKRRLTTATLSYFEKEAFESLLGLKIDG